MVPGRFIAPHRMTRTSRPARGLHLRPSCLCWTGIAQSVAVLSVLLAVLLAVALPGPSALAEPLAHISGADPAPMVIPLDDTKGLTLFGTLARVVRYHGRQAIELTENPATSDTASLEDMALLDRPEFKDGTIDVWVAGTLGPHAAVDDRGFIGLAFRSTSDGSRFENIYLRPTNGRATDQLRRNHATQYASVPDYPWKRLRTESPGTYESYVDLVAGEWTHIRIAVNGQSAQLFVNDARQPCLVVNDLKMDAVAGRIGLWIGPGTRGYFSRLVVTPAPRRG
jgi:hypothetical protein